MHQRARRRRDRGASNTRREPSTLTRRSSLVVAARLDQPREVDDDVGAGEVQRVVGRDVGLHPAHLRRVPVRAAGARSRRSPPRARPRPAPSTTLVPTFPVAPVTTTCTLISRPYPTWVAASAMKALTWHGAHDVRVDTVPDPTIEQPTDAIIKVTSTGICGSDLHLYEVLGPYLDEGDILGHEPMGIVEEVGAEVTAHQAGRPRRDPVQHLLRALLDVRHRACSRSARRPRCASTAPAPRCSATRSSTARCRAARPSTCACRRRSTARSRCPRARRTTASSTSPTSSPPPGRRSSTRTSPSGGSVVVLGLGPIGEMCTRIAQHQGAETVIGIDLVPERLARRQRPRRRRARPRGARRHRRPRPRAHRRARPRRRHRRRRHGGARRADRQARPPPHRPAARRGRAQADARRPASTASPRCTSAIELVRRGGTVSLSGVYGGAASPMPLLQMFDKQITLRMGQANVRRWVDDILPLLTGDDDPLGVDNFATHHIAARARRRTATRSSRRSRTAPSRSS